MSSKVRKKITLEGKIKLVLSSMLVVYSIIISCLTGKLVVTAMLMSFCGDIYLMKNGNCFHNKDECDFKIGVFMFMMSHIIYTGIMNTSVSKTIIFIMFIVVSIYIIVIALRLKGTVLIAAVYSGVLILSVINTGFSNTVAFIGGILFLISDALIGICDVIKYKSLGRHILVWGTYVPAQILLLSSFLI